MRKLNLSPYQWEEYLNLKEKYQNKWRDKIFRRDNHKCRVCESTAITLAHITPVSGFVTFALRYKLPISKAIITSYSFDNLITLCLPCHSIQHSEEITKENEDRKRKIEQIFIDIIKKRGWKRGGDKLKNTVSVKHEKYICNISMRRAMAERRQGIFRRKWRSLL